MKTFFIADTHFGHENIISHCNRPFKSIDEMDNRMTDLWNNAVGPKDRVFHLGDFAFRKDIAERIFPKLNGHKTLLLGNHDQAWTAKLGWANVTTLMELTDNDRFLVLFHYPMLSWNRQYHGSYHLFGHVHNNSFKHPHPNAFNVSVEVINYTPITFDDLLATRDFGAKDDHSDP